MKRAFYIFFSAFVALAAMAEENEPDAMFIFRNDGDFNAIYVSEIDSITFTDHDRDGVLYEDNGVQVIWTPDSVYIIPVDAIDSITFDKPETTLQPDVILMDENWLPYIISVEDLTIVFNANVVNIWQPKVGDVLAYLIMDEYFPEGFAGRVIDIQYTGATIIVTCEEVSIEDIFDTIIVMDGYAEINVPAESAHNMHKIGGEASLSGTYEVSYTFERGPMKSVALGSVTLGCRVFVAMGKNIPLKIEMTVMDREYISLSTHIEIEVEDEKLKPEEPVISTSEPVYVCTPIGCFPTGFTVYLNIFPVLEYGFSGMFHAELEAESSSYTTSSFYDGSWHPNKPQRTSSVTPTLQASAEGRVGVGLEVDYGLKFVKNLLKTQLEMTGTVGLKTDTELDFLQGGNIAYNVFKDAHVDAYAKAEAELSWHIDVPYLEDLIPDGSKELIDPLECTLKEWYLFPEFSEPKLTPSTDNKTLRVQSNVTRSLILPVYVGYNMVYETEDYNYINSEYDTERYWSTPRALDLTFNNCERELCYNIYPAFKLLSLDVQADPSKDICLWYSVVGTWTCTGGSWTTTNQLKSMTCYENGHMSQTYYNTNTGETKTYNNDTYTYNPETKMFVMHKGNGTSPAWHVTEISDHKLTLKSTENDFCWYFTR